MNDKLNELIKFNEWDLCKLEKWTEGHKESAHNALSHTKVLKLTQGQWANQS